MRKIIYYHEYIKNLKIINKTDTKNLAKIWILNLSMQMGNKYVKKCKTLLG